MKKKALILIIFILVGYNATLRVHSIRKIPKRKYSNSVYTLYVIQYNYLYIPIHVSSFTEIHLRSEDVCSFGNFQLPLFLDIGFRTN